MKHILFTSYDGITDPLGQSQVLPYLIGLTRKGYRFTILSAEKEEGLQKNEAIIRKIMEAHDMQWVYVKYTKRPPILSTVFDLWRMHRKIVRHARRQGGFDMVHSRALISAILGYPLSKRFGAGFLFDTRSFWADERKDVGLWNMKNPVYRLVYKYFKKQEKKLLIHANQVTILTEKGKQELGRWNYAPDLTGRTTVIPCCADLDHFSPDSVSAEAKSALRRELGIGPSDFVLSYVGSFGTWYFLDKKMLLFKMLLGIYPEAKFLLISGSDPALAYAASDALQIPRDKIIVRSASRKEVPLYISLSSVSVFYIFPFYSKIASSPTKQGEIMGMGIPIICNAGVGDSDTILETTGSGLVMHDFSEAEIRAILPRIPELLRIPPAQIRQGAFRYYGLAEGIEKYAGVYAKILNNPNP